MDLDQKSVAQASPTTPVASAPTVSRLDVLLANRPREAGVNPIMQLLAIAAAARAPRYAAQLVSMPAQQAAAVNVTRQQAWKDAVALEERERQRDMEQQLQELRGQQAAEQARLQNELNRPKTEAEIERAKAAAQLDKTRATELPLDGASRRTAEEARTLQNDTRLRLDIGNRFFDNALKLGRFSGSDQATPGAIRLLAPEYVTSRELNESTLGRLNRSAETPKPMSDAGIQALGDALTAEPSARQRDLAAQTDNRDAGTAYIKAQTVTEGERAKQAAAQTEVLKADVLVKKANAAKTLKEIAEMDERLAMERQRLSQGERQLQESIRSRSVTSLMTAGKTASEQAISYLKQADELEKAASAVKVNEKDGTRTALLPPETQRKMQRQAQEYRSLANRALQTSNSAAAALRPYGIQLPTVPVPGADGVTVEQID